MLSKLAILEISELSDRAERLARGGASERAQAQVLMQRIGTIEKRGISSDEVRSEYSTALSDSLKPRKVGDAAYRTMFDKYVRGNIGEREMRDFLSGSSALAYTAGNQGGFTVPMEYDSTLRVAMAQVDPVLDESVCDFSMSDGPQLAPEQISGFDLSTISGQLVGESQVQNPQAIPTVFGKTLNSNFIFKASFGASLESQQDVPNFPEKIAQAVGVALSRTISQHVMTGRGGSTDILGITNSLGAPTVTNTTPGKIVLGDLTNIMFSVNRFYRNQPKCGWLCNDQAYKLIRNATSTDGVPLLNVHHNDEMLLGKKIYISPSLSIASAGVGLLLFGDFSHLVVRASRSTVAPYMQQAQADISKGSNLWIGRCRADSAYFDASGGNFPPIVLASIN
jgi:HK97 family phage major capsid protein